MCNKCSCAEDRKANWRIPPFARTESGAFDYRVVPRAPLVNPSVYDWDGTFINPYVYKSASDRCYHQKKPRRKIHLANSASNRTRGESKAYGSAFGDRAFLFAFGAYGGTFVLAYARDLEDALEEAAGYLADNAPGHILKHDSQELKDLYEEAAAECTEEDCAAEDGHPACGAWERATADLTYTESGYLTSYEWMIVGEDMSPAEIAAFAHGRSAK